MDTISEAQPPTIDFARSGHKRSAVDAGIDRIVDGGILGSTDAVTSNLAPPSGKRKRTLTPQEEQEASYKQQINSLTKVADLSGAVSVYADMVSHGIAITPGIFNAVLSIAARYSGAITPALLQKCVAVFSDMEKSAVKPNEAAYSSIIRACTLGQNGKQALHYLDRMLEDGVEPRLRTYAPLLQHFALQGDAKTTIDLYNAMQKRGILPTQPEYAAAITAYAKASNHDAIEHLLRNVCEEHVLLAEPQLVSSLEAYFTGSHEPTDSAGKPWPWRCTYTSIDPETGLCPITGKHLRSIQLSAETHSTLLKQVEGLASRAPQLFAQYQEWLKEHGPFDVIVDGANVGFSNQNFEGGALMYTQIEAVVQAFQRLGLRVLIVLSKRWLDQSRFSSASARRPITKRQRKKMIEASHAMSEKLSASVEPTLKADTTANKEIDAAPTATDLLKDSDVASVQAKVFGEKVPHHLHEILKDTSATAGAGHASDYFDFSDSSYESSQAGSDDEDAFSSDTSYVKTAPAPPYVAAVDADSDTQKAPFIVARWAAENVAYKTLPGTNDDWFWLYAALSQSDQHKVIVISNDLMRDHHFQMLAPKAFTQWRERHQVNFGFRYDPDMEGFLPTFKFPRKHSHRAQVSEDGSAWHFPLEGSPSSWLVAWKAGAEQNKAAPTDELR